MTSKGEVTSHNSAANGALASGTARHGQGPSFTIYKQNFNIDRTEYTGLLAPNTQFFRWRKDKATEDITYYYKTKEGEDATSTRLWEAVKNCMANFAPCPLNPEIMVPQGKDHTPLLKAYLRAKHKKEYAILESEWEESKKLKEKYGFIFRYPEMYSAKRRFVNERIPNKSFESLDDLKEAMGNSYPHAETLCRYDKSCTKVGKGCPYNHTLQSWCQCVEDTVRTKKLHICSNRWCCDNHALGRLDWCNYMDNVFRIRKAKAKITELTNLPCDDSSTSSEHSTIFAVLDTLDEGETKEKVKKLVDIIDRCQSEISSSKYSLKKDKTSKPDKAEPESVTSTLGKEKAGKEKAGKEKPKQKKNQVYRELAADEDIYT